MPSSGWGAKELAEAAAMLAVNPAFYVFVALIALFVVCKWPPWRNRKASE